MALLAALGPFAVSCGPRTSTGPTSVPTNSNNPQNVFDDYLNADFAPADGFDFAVGDRNGKGQYVDKATGQSHSGWYVSTHFVDIYSYGIHPGEDWSGNGPPASDLGQEVHAVANGKVAFADFCGKLWGNVVMIDHLFYEITRRNEFDRSMHICAKSKCEPVRRSSDGK